METIWSILDATAELATLAAGAAMLLATVLL